MAFKKYIKNLFQDALRKRGFRISNLYNLNFFESLMYQILRSKKHLTFIQIGANDGKRFDPMYHFVKYNKNNVQGYVVEPIHDYYKDLCHTYKTYNNIRPINVAIHQNLNETVIYRVAKEFEKNVPEFALGIASFDKEHHKKTNIPSQFITEEKVKCSTLKRLLVEHKINHVDVLVLDTEGYDYEILMSLDVNEISPLLIHFEHGLKSGTMSIKEFSNVLNKMKEADYQFYIDKADVTAYKSNLVFDFNKYKD